MSLQRLHIHGLEEASASQMRQTSRVVAIGLVGRKRLERLVGLPALDADHRKTKLVQPVKQDWRHASGLEHDAAATRRFRPLASIVFGRAGNRKATAINKGSPCAAPGDDI